MHGCEKSQIIKLTMLSRPTVEDFMNGLSKRHC